MKIGVKQSAGRDSRSIVHTDDRAGESSHTLLERPRLGRDLSRLTAHPSGQSPMQFALTRMAERIVPSHGVIDGHCPDGCPVNERSLGHHVRAVLGMPHEANQIDPALAPYLDELGKNASPTSAEPVTFSAFSLLCLLYIADQAPGTSGYGQLERESFMSWLKKQLAPDTVRVDLIPGSYFERVQVSTPVGVFLPRQCTVECDSGGAIEVPAMRPPELQNWFLSGRDLRGTDLRGANLQGANLQRAQLQFGDLRNAKLPGAKLQNANLQRANLQRANLKGVQLQFGDLRNAKLQDARLQDANLQGADLQGADLQAAKLQDADLEDAKLLGADLQGANLEGANLEGANLEGANLRGANLRCADLRDVSLQDADLQNANLQNANLQGANLNGVNLEGVNLDDALLFSVPEQCATGLRGTPEGGMSLISLTYRCNLKDVPPDRWRTEDLDLLFNHRNNEGCSVLYDIERLSDGGRTKKQVLMRSVAGELDRLRQGAPV
ncbi:pentapeptide repeat-containing protein, partial [Paraburkholderia sediminicola]|uniref:pentapeptide repeat-containing protein n=1 Tax=Paraburkholderia sediminicola TaxID=458836 RepID=UPI0038BD3559